MLLRCSGNSLFYSMLLRQHWLCPGDNESPDHNPWLALTTVSGANLAHSGWKYTWGSCGLSIYEPDYPEGNGARFLMHELLLLVPSHEWHNFPHVVWGLWKHKQSPSDLAWVHSRGPYLLHLIISRGWLIAGWVKQGWGRSGDSYLMHHNTHQRAE